MVSHNWRSMAYDDLVISSSMGFLGKYKFPVGPKSTNPLLWENTLW
jgi:hypothetical protein